MWEAVSGTPDPRLRGSVAAYAGYVERAIRPTRRLEVPFAGIPMILGLGPDEVGWSRRHLAARFRVEVGLQRKAVGRILRFQRVAQSLKLHRGAGLADTAYACGYADQAHTRRRGHSGRVPNVHDPIARGA
jgi:AraC-like DNA-binding protein